MSADAESDFYVVKEGFSWPALIFTAFWALWHRMWLVFVILLVAGVALEFALTISGADEISALAISLGYSLFVGFGANDWRRRSLARRGMQLMGIVAAPDAEAALHRYVDRNPGLASRRAASPDQVLGLS
jgi:hypothetical protein